MQPRVDPIDNDGHHPVALGALVAAGDLVGERVDRTPVERRQAGEQRLNLIAVECDSVIGKEAQRRRDRALRPFGRGRLFSRRWLDSRARRSLG